jgi:hypothetical protein
MLTSSRDDNVPKDVGNVEPIEHALVDWRRAAGKNLREKLKLCGEKLSLQLRLQLCNVTIKFTGDGLSINYIFVFNRVDNTTTLKTRSRHETPSLGLKNKKNKMEDLQ